MRKPIIFLLVVLVLLYVPVGCLVRRAGPAVTTASDDSTQPAVTSSLPTETEPAPSSDPLSTSTTETSSPDTETTATEPEPVPEIFFQPLPAGQTHYIDLNNDGIDEKLMYDVFNDYSFTLLVNDVATQPEGNNFLDGWFFLVDLDRNDEHFDLAIQELGPSADYMVSFYTFDGEKLVCRGLVPGTICDPYVDDVGSQEYGLGTIRLDGEGGLIAFARGAVLHSWYYDEPWKLVGGNLERIHQSFIPMHGYDPETESILPELPVELKLNLPLYASPSASTATLMARAGEAASIVRTDNLEWVELRIQSGETGWFRLGSNPYSVVVGDREYFSEEVFDGLWFFD
ncbi:MAG: hypothetical protein ACOX1U_05325 [Saccharofermentanales bacterium]|nr:hypothetical protein [Clostridiaceae bacterium]